MAENEKDTDTIFKNFSKKLLSIGKKIGIVIIVVLLILIIIIASTYRKRFEDAVNTTSNTTDPNSSDYMPYGPQIYFDSVYISEERGLIAELSIDEMWKKESKYSQYLSSKEALAYFLNAQLVTQYPYVEGLPKEQLNGTIRFFRNNSSTPMTCVSEESFGEYVDQYNGGNSSVKDKILNSFAIQSSGKIKVAYLIEDSYYAETDCPDKQSEVEEKGRGTATNIDGKIVSQKTTSEMKTTVLSYTDYVKNYILPFNLLWSMVVMANSAQAPRKCRTFCPSYCLYGI